MPVYVHLDILCDESSVFRAAFLGEFKEATIQSMDLPEDDVESVERMIQWLYFNDYELVKWRHEDGELKAAKSQQQCYWQLAKLNTLADKYHIIGLSDSIIDQLYILHSKWLPPNKEYWHPTIDMAAYVYNNTTENSSFRKLLIAWYAWDIDKAWVQDAKIQRQLLDVPGLAVDIIIAWSIQDSDPDQTRPFEHNKSKYYHQPKELNCSHNRMMSQGGGVHKPSMG